MEDQRPSSDQLVRIDSECLSSIISGPDPKADGRHRHLHLSRAGGHHQGVSLAFSPVTAVQGSLFYPREQIEDCHPVVQYSILDGEGQNLPYRNLMGTQLHRDLAG
ncbi:hypothetical protein MLD38_005300 [Melastoma candidum]|uniref:Uncharacterized protein n=1 Tax=Melastoma candidum TaxID=119954 RepID=A0ACB9SGZ6_9MYRT|nr:hypothetical protein MLD38_005300 [Melastoma candidum]